MTEQEIKAKLADYMSVCMQRDEAIQQLRKLLHASKRLTNTISGVVADGTISHVDLNYDALKNLEAIVEAATAKLNKA